MAVKLSGPLVELKNLVREAIRVQLEQDRYKRQFRSDALDFQSGEQVKAPPSPSPSEEDDRLYLWGVPLLEDERTDIILEKLRIINPYMTRTVDESLALFKKIIKWRREFGTKYACDLELLQEEEDDGHGVEFIFVVCGQNRERRPVCYNTLHNNFLNHVRTTTCDKKAKIRAWVLAVERIIRKLVTFQPGQANGVYVVNDLQKCSVSRLLLINKLTPLLMRHYPPTILDQVFINTPAIFHVTTFFQWSASYCYYRPSETAAALYKNINPGLLPVAYGGCWDPRSNRHGAVAIFYDYSHHTYCMEHHVRKAAHTVEWNVRVLGWAGMTYSVEFHPHTQGDYVTLIYREKKIRREQDSVIRGSFKASQPGTLCLPFSNKRCNKATYLYMIWDYPSPE